MSVVHLVPDSPTVAEALTAAQAAKLKQVVVIGWGPDGSCYLDLGGADLPGAMWLLKIAEDSLLEASRNA